MTGYVIQRLLLFVPTLLLVSFLVFAIMRLLPGDPAIAILSAGGEGSYTEDDIIRMRAKLGTDKPFHIQYAVWIRDSVQGDFGESFFYPNVTVASMAKTRFPVSMELAILALIISYVVAVPLGVISAVKQDTWFDYVAKLFAVAGVALPTFWVGILVIFFLVVFFNWLPPLGYKTLWEDPIKNLQQFVFPALALGYFNMAFAARLTRSSMLEVLREDYIRTARSKGLRELIVISRHALKNAFLPVITVAGFQLSRLLGGAVLMEVIFVLPGMGKLLVDSVLVRDYPIVQTFIMLVAVSVLVLNLVVDLMYGWINPRIRYG
jgi:peptide/nickel transport system permease protein